MAGLGTSHDSMAQTPAMREPTRDSEQVQVCSDTGHAQTPMSVGSKAQNRLIAYLHSIDPHLHRLATVLGYDALASARSDLGQGMVLTRIIGSG